jgi:hypothetical protein
MKDSRDYANQWLQIAEKGCSSYLVAERKDNNPNRNRRTAFSELSQGPRTGAVRWQHSIVSSATIKCKTLPEDSSDCQLCQKNFSLSIFLDSASLKLN